MSSTYWVIVTMIFVLAMAVSFVKVLKPDEHITKRKAICFLLASTLLFAFSAWMIMRTGEEEERVRLTKCQYLGQLLNGSYGYKCGGDADTIHLSHLLVR